MPNGGQISFGAGLLSFIPSGSNPSPVPVGILQDVTLKVSASTKKLYGQSAFPAAVAEAERDVSGTAKFGQFYGALIKQAISGSTIATGQTLAEIGAQYTIPSTPYQVTVTNSATFVENLGVYDLTAGKTMTRVASGPATGQYAVTAGVYTFASADAAHVVSISSSYTTTAGFTTSVTNPLMGAANTFSMLLFETYLGQQSGVKLYSCIIPGLDFAIKNTDFQIQSMNFEAYADSQNRVMELYTAE